jgi:hypothetical protein
VLDDFPIPRRLFYGGAAGNLEQPEQLPLGIGTWYNAIRASVNYPVYRLSALVLEGGSGVST